MEADVLKNGIVIPTESLEKLNVKLRKYIGSGNFSVVYETTANEVIKIVNVDDIDFGNSFDDEVEIYKEMSNRGIAPKYIDSSKCIGYNEDGDKLKLGLLVTEKYDTTLEKHLKKERNISIDNIRDLQQKISEIHKAGYVHNDLNPGNVMLKYDKSKIIDIKIIDFGLSFNIENPPGRSILKSYIEHNSSTSRFKLTDKDQVKILLMYDDINLYG